MVAYKTIQPPFTLKFWDMSKKELRDYFNWFQLEIPERLNELAAAVRSSNGFQDWAADYSPFSLNALGSWFAGEVQTRPRTQAELEEISSQSPFPISERELTDRTISLAVDIAMYLSQVLLRHNPSLKWEQTFGSKKYIDYGQPVIGGFSHGIPVNPVGAVTTLAYEFAKKRKTGTGLREMYDKLQKQVTAEPR